MPAEWPDRFLYVCNAGRGAVVNAAPLIHADLKRVAEVVVLCGADGPNPTNPNDRAEAADPARRLGVLLAELTQGRLGKQAKTFRILYGRPLIIADWRRHMEAIMQSTALPIVYNLKGGTKEMSVGASLALSAKPTARIQLITVRDHPLQSELVTPEGQEPLPLLGRHLSLDEYLRLYGFREHMDSRPDRRHEQRQNLQQWYTRNRACIEAFSAIFLPAATSAWPSLQMMTRPVEPAAGGGGYRTPLRIAANPLANVPEQATIAQAITALEGTDGLRLEKDAEDRLTAFTIGDAFIARFLRGGWVEAAVFLALSHAASGIPDVEVAANLGLQPDGTDERVTEIDIAVMIRSQMLFIEAKSSSMTNRATRESGERSLAQLETNKRQLLGQVGRVLLVNPCVTEQELQHARGAVPDRLRQGGGEAFLGPNAIVQLVRRMTDRIAPKPT